MEGHRSKQIVDFYKSQSKTYDDNFDFAYWRILYSEYRNWLQRHLKNSVESMVELGWGTGIHARILEKHAKNFFGVDICTDFIKIASDRCREGNFHPHITDITNLPFKDNSFDAVICLNTFDHVFEPEKVLSEVNRICKPGGKFIFDISSSKNLDLYRFLGAYGKSGFISAIKGMSEKKVELEWSLKDDNKISRKIQTVRFNPMFFENILNSFNFKILEKKGSHISTMLIPEKIQVDSSSKILSKIDNLLFRFDKILNNYPFFINRATSIFYSCTLCK